MPFFTHADASLFYTVQGPSTAPPILLLHGWTCDSHDWSYQIPCLLKHGFRVIAMDLRGHGRSSAPEGSYSFATLCHDIIALIQYLELAPVVLVGHSMSTVLSSIIAAEHSEIVKALVLVHPIYGLASARNMSSFHDKVQANPAQAPQMTADVFNAVMYTATTPDWVRTWTYRRVLGTSAHVIIGCIAGNAEATGRILGVNVECKHFMQSRKCPRLAICSSNEALEWESELGFGEQDEVHLVEEGTFLQIVAHERVNEMIMRWLQKQGIVASEEARL